MHYTNVRLDSSAAMFEIKLKRCSIIAGKNSFKSPNKTATY